MSEPSPEIQTSSAGDWKVTLIVCVLIAAVVGGVAYFIFETEPTAKKSNTSKKTAMLVAIEEVRPERWTPRIEAVGVVRPSQDLVLSPQIAGRVVSLSPGFEPGRFVSKGDVLVRLEAADWRNVIAQRESALEQARAELVLEQGRQGAARAEFDYLEQQLEGTERELVLREPQLESARARVRAAKASLEQARRDLSRVTIRAPFDAHVVSRDVNVGSQVSSSDRLARLIGTQRHWIVINVPREKLKWLAIPEGETPGSEVHVRSRTWSKETRRVAHLHSLVGMLDEVTQMASVIAAIDDPFARTEDGAGPPLLAGEFLEASIVGEPLEEVYRISREWLRSDQTVWLMRDDTLHIVQVEVLLEDATHAYISSGLQPGDQVVTTSIATPTEGAPLRLDGEKSERAGGRDE